MGADGTHRNEPYYGFGQNLRGILHNYSREKIKM